MRSGEERRARVRLHQLRQREVRQRRLRRALLAASLAAPVASLVAAAFLSGRVSPAVVAPLSALVAGLVVAGLSRPASTRDVALHVDRVLPEAEDSCALLLGPTAGLGPLELLQRGRVARRLAMRDLGDLLPSTGLPARLTLVALSLVLAVAGGAMVEGSRRAPQVDARPSLSAPAEEAASSEPEVPTIELEVTPPSYTGRPAFTAAGLTTEIPVDSALTWRVAGGGWSSGSVVLSGPREIPLVAGGSGLEATMTLSTDELYRVVVFDGVRKWSSEFARLTALPDRPPILRVDEPVDSSRTVDRAEWLELRAAARDDYGLTDAELVLTLASGQGEGVRFRQQRLRLTAIQRQGAQQAAWHERLTLAPYGLGPGDEIYYYVEVADNRRPSPQTTRSRSFRLRLAGGAGESVGLGRGLPVLSLPEFFRSQRQIILDTERLIDERRSLAEDAFTVRSEMIGVDQRALRMRYGVLLGDEFDSGRPLEEHDDEHEPPDEDGDDLIAELGHSHDSAETATYFPDEVRVGLKAALAEMWSAEGELRGHRPEAALPYENRALELLKRVQETIRVYVQKAGYEVPPLDLERRLTGDLSEVRQNWRRRTDGRGPVSGGRALVERLRGLRSGGPRTHVELAKAVSDALLLLSKDAVGGENQLSALAAARRALAALEAGGVAHAEDLDRVEAALYERLDRPAPPLGPGRSGSRSGVDRLYRAALAEVELP